MSTLFPYNQISKIPTRVLDSIQPLITSKIEELNDLIAKLESALLSLSPNSSCDDAEILQLKTLLRNVETVINQLQSIFQFVPVISNTFRFLINFATTSANIQLAIPTVPGVPAGPLTQTLNSFVDLITISSTCINALANNIDLINVFLEKTFNITNQTSYAVSNVCGGAIDTSSPDITLLSENITLTRLERLYPSNFYRKVNVSDEDLQQRFDAIQELIINQINVISNLNEAPSKVLYGAGVPASSIGQPGDYYIDTIDQTVYGPKSDSSNWL
jgi:hypothetical protein